jgi:hypothetical protein
MRSSSRDQPPKPRDVLSRTHDASRRNTLSTSGEAPQIACVTYEEAMARADRFAHSQHVDVWQTDDDRAFTQIIECRGGQPRMNTPGPRSFDRM